MKLIVGLGNPGDKYTYTRHNIGFWCLDLLVDKYCSDGLLYNNKFGVEATTCLLEGQKVMFVKPMLFMNKSGGPIKRLMDFYKIDSKDILVIHDELDLKEGDIKFKWNGGDNGHNGLKDITRSLGIDNKYWKLKLGIGRPDEKYQVVDYVLGKIGVEVYTDFELKINVICKYIDQFLAL